MTCHWTCCLSVQSQRTHKQHCSSIQTSYKTRGHRDAWEEQASHRVTTQSSLSLQPPGRCEHGIRAVSAPTQSSLPPLGPTHLLEGSGWASRAGYNSPAALAVKQDQAGEQVMGWGTRWGSALRQSRIKPKFAEKQVFRKKEMEISPSSFLILSWGTLQCKHGEFLQFAI